MANGIIYLACPYTDDDPALRRHRFRAVTVAAAALIKRGYIVYSPITMTHPMDVVLAGDSATLGSNFWVAFDQAFMDACSEIFVLTLDGWEKSKGIKREITHFKSQGKRVTFLSSTDELLQMDLLARVE